MSLGVGSWARQAITGFVCMGIGVLLQAQNVGIGVPSPGARLDVRVPAGWSSPLVRVREDLSTRFIIKPGGLVGINTPNPSVPLQIHGGTDASLTSGGYLQIGTNSSNIVIDDNEIMARNKTAGTAQNLHLNMDGGNVYMHYNLAGAQHAFLATGEVGIGTSVPARMLHVAGDMRLELLVVPPVSIGTSDSIMVRLGNGDVTGIGFTGSASDVLRGDGTFGPVLTPDHDWYVKGTTSAPTSINDSIYTMGDVGINTNNPQYALHIEGDGMIVAKGAYNSGDTMPAGPKVAFIWNPRKIAIRAGGVQGSQWDDANVGLGSVAFGLNNVAAGNGSVVGGGSNDTVIAQYGTIGGGTKNYVSGQYGTVAGGYLNRAEGLRSAVGGGYGNIARGTGSFVGGGVGNLADGGTYIFNGAVVAGGNNNKALGQTSAITGGQNNVAAGHHTFVGGGHGNKVYGQSSVIVGGGTVSLGDTNVVWGNVSGIVVGTQNVVTGDSALIGSGRANRIDAAYGVIGGGKENQIPSAAAFGFIGSGWKNVAGDSFAVVVGGYGNKALRYGSVVVGGGVYNSGGTTDSNVADGVMAFIGTGLGNRIAAPPFVPPDYGGLFSFIGTGSYNSAGFITFIGTGSQNNALYKAFVGIGTSCYAGGGDGGAFIGAGTHDTVLGTGAIVNGYRNKVLDAYGFIGTGQDNMIDSGAVYNAFILTGLGNYVKGRYSGVLSGLSSYVVGDHSLAFGPHDTVNASFVFAFGSNIKTSNENYRVYLFDSTSAYSGFLVINRRDGDFPIHVGTNTANGNGAYLTAGGVWTNASSRAFKDRFEPLSGAEVLEKINRLNIQAWYYKNTQERHIGPVAEEFHQQFQVGDLSHPDHEHYLSALDVAGVSLLGVQVLYRRQQELEQRLAQLEAENQLLKQRLAQLEQRSSSYLESVVTNESQ